MTAKLIEILARADAERLKALLGASTMALVHSVVPGAGNPKGLAELVVSQYTPAGSLRTPDVRAVVFDALETDEAVELCELLRFPTGDPINTLRGGGFDHDKSNADTLLAWFLVDYDDSRVALPPESSRRVEPTHRLKEHQLQGFRNLRRRLSDPTADVLVNMPAGAGKLRLVATALVDLFRAEPDGRLIVWLATGERLCEDAFDELVERWRDIGSRDVTAHRLYGDAQLPDLGNLHDGIVVADITKLSAKHSDVPEELSALGRRARVVALSDASFVTVPEYAAMIAGMKGGGDFNLVGLCAASNDFLEATGAANDVRTAYLPPYIAIDDVDPLNLLRQNGDVVAVESEMHTSPPSGGASDDVAVATECELERSRDKQLIERLVAETTVGRKVVFFADSAEQARMFVGILALRAAPAFVVTGSMSAEQRTQEIARFNNRDNAKVLCVHDALISGSDVPLVTTALVASRGLSGAVYGLTIGRLASGRGRDARPLKVIAIDGDIAVLGQVIAHWDGWRNLETGR